LPAHVSYEKVFVFAVSQGYATVKRLFELKVQIVMFKSQVQCIKKYCTWLCKIYTCCKQSDGAFFWSKHHFRPVLHSYLQELRYRRRN